MTTRQPSKACRYQDCEDAILPWFILCRTHNSEKQNGKINQCSDCEQYKPVRFPQCRDCYDGPGPSPEENEVFTYIMKLDGGAFYAGHTQELRERKDEHRDGKVKSTSGKNPLLVWFEITDTIPKAKDREAQLKGLIAKNEREIRRMVNKFQDIIRLVDPA